MAGTVVQVRVESGDPVAAGQSLVVLEFMKMEHVVRAEEAGTVEQVSIAQGDSVVADQPLLVLGPASADAADRESLDEPEAEAGIRADLQAVIDRHAFTLDSSRPEAVERRRSRGQRTARENIADLCDDDSFVEYGALTYAAQRARRELDDLIRNTPADGLVAGVGTVNGDTATDRARCVVMAYDATVLAGTQGMRNHQKTDRMLQVALAEDLPLVLLAEGGGGRPGDTDTAQVAGLDLHTFAAHARLSGQVPMIGIASGRCFAGNAALLGCCDVVIATADSTIGMGGPAMIEGGGLGVFAPEEVGPSAVQSSNGVIDVLVDDEEAAVAAARRYLGYFQGAVADWAPNESVDLRTALPENRVRTYDVRRVVAGLADVDSVLELRAGFAPAVVTALVRIEGRPVGILANDPTHLGGAIDADAADKAARFMRLCDVHGLPIVSLIDTPGFMVGPDVEAQAHVRHASRMFVAGAHLRVPLLAVVLRKGYGLGAMAMAGGSLHAPAMTVAWPTGELGAMGLEGAVRLGFRKELDAAAEGAERDALFEQLVAAAYERGSAISMAEALEIDAVIDPAETRRLLSLGLASSRVRPRTPGPLDPW
jgi:acetyl-CoA carboxylase carboxyltransferase component